MPSVEDKAPTSLVLLPLNLRRRLVGKLGFEYVLPCSARLHAHTHTQRHTDRHIVAAGSISEAFPALAAKGTGDVYVHGVRGLQILDEKTWLPPLQPLHGIQGFLPASSQDKGQGSAGMAAEGAFRQSRHARAQTCSWRMQHAHDDVQTIPVKERISVM